MSSGLAEIGDDALLERTLLRLSTMKSGRTAFNGGELKPKLGFWLLLLVVVGRAAAAAV